MYAGTEKSFTSMSNLGMSDNTFNTGAFTEPKSRVIVSSFDRLEMPRLRSKYGRRYLEMSSASKHHEASENQANLPLATPTL